MVMFDGLEFLFRAGKLFGWIAQIKWGGEGSIPA